jgi:hypothetical protein
VKGETKRIALSSPGNPSALIGKCEVLVTLDSKGGLTLGPLPAQPQQPLNAALACGFSAVIDLRFRAVVLQSE